MKYNNNTSDGSFGLELIIDLHDCDATTLTLPSLREFVDKLLEATDMEAFGPLRVWEDYQTQEPHIQGVAVFQWITTSHIMVYALTMTNLVMINLFSCKDFDADKVETLAKEYFGTEIAITTKVVRGNV